MVIPPANEQARDQVGELCERVQAATGQTAQVGFVDQDYTGEEAKCAAAVHNIDSQNFRK